MTGTGRHTAATGLLALACLVASGCTWEPSARAVQPQRLASGSFEVLGMLDASRYAGLVRDPETKPSVEILDLRTDRRCAFPEATFPIAGVMTAGSSVDHPPFLWPSAHFFSDGPRTLSFADEKCALRDVDVPVGSNLSTLALDEDQREVLLFGDDRGNLSLYDPWNDELTKIASGVSRFNQALRAQSGGKPVGPQMLWLIENGALTLRTLEGELLVKRGTNVSELSQAAFASVRVAYVDGGDLYEAVAPDFTRAPVARDACTVSYSGAKLSFFSPCEARQLVRVDLSTGQREEFALGIYAEWKQNGFVFERGVDKDGKNQLFVTLPGGMRTEVRPTLLADVQPLDATRIVGSDGSANFGIWSERDGFKTLLKKASGVFGFIDTRTNRLSWVAMHEVEGGRGTLAYLEQPAFKLNTIARKVATSSVSVQGLFPVEEPVLVYVRDATVITKAGQAPQYEGSLDARVLSGELESTISENVTSYALVPDPNVAGLLYTTSGTKGRGLWFAAL